MHVHRYRNTCFYCGLKSSHLTKDHILPKRTGAGLITHGGVKNWRWACKPCNQRREHVRDCPAVLLMTRTVALDAGVHILHVMAAWGFIGGKLRRNHAKSLIGPQRRGMIERLMFKVRVKKLVEEIVNGQADQRERPRNGGEVPVQAG